jgi:hypothetical protein
VWTPAVDRLLHLRDVGKSGGNSTRARRRDVGGSAATLQGRRCGRLQWIACCTAFTPVVPRSLRSRWPSSSFSFLVSLVLSFFHVVVVFVGLRLRSSLVFVFGLRWSSSSVFVGLRLRSSLVLVFVGLGLVVLILVVLIFVVAAGLVFVGLPLVLSSLVFVSSFSSSSFSSSSFSSSSLPPVLVFVRAVRGVAFSVVLLSDPCDPFDFGGDCCDRVTRGDRRHGGTVTRWHGDTVTARRRSDRRGGGSAAVTLWSTLSAATRVSAFGGVRRSARVDGDRGRCSRTGDTWRAARVGRPAVQPYSSTAVQPHSRPAVQPSSRTAVQPYSRTAVQPHSHSVKSYSVKTYSEVVRRKVAERARAPSPDEPRAPSAPRTELRASQRRPADPARI